MRRNYGSLDLAALDLHAPHQQQHLQCSAGDTSSASTSHAHALANELAHLHVADCDCDGEWDAGAQPQSVGFPIELFAHMQDGGESDDDVASHILRLHDRANAPRRRKRSLSDHSELASGSGETHRASPLLTGGSSSAVGITSVSADAAMRSQQQQQHVGATELSPRLPIAPPPLDRSHPAAQQRHSLELHALRCLSLNLMLSSSVPSGRSGVGVSVTAPQPSTSVPKMSSFEIGCQPQTDRATTVLLAGRRGSLPRNMIQSV